MIIATIAGIFISRAIAFEPGTDLRYLKLSNVSSAFADLPEYFCHWTFFESAGLNKWPSKFFMLNLHSQLRYFTGKFQELHLIVFVVYDSMD